MPDDRSDDWLMQAVLRGNREALGALVQRHHRRLVLRIYGLCGDWAAAEDLAQETFLHVAAAPRYEGQGRFTAWLFAIARNLWLKDRHRRGIEARALERKSGTPAADASRGSQDDSDKALARLSERDRTLLVLRHMEEMSYEEIAAEMGMSPKAVSVGLCRARDRFREELNRIRSKS
jgi:RNA polymerase sigma-70 factor (ECF subfamily)